ncbi:cupin domain-containing protein [Aneurinibacillus tyrosinisolvens]
MLRLTNCSFPWTVRYDEVVYVLSGEIQIISDRKTLTGREGDTFF